MKFLPLLWRSLTRKKVRTTFTLLSILVSFLLFGLLGALERALSLGSQTAGTDRLVTQHKVSFIQPLPLRYWSTIQSVDGVEVVSHLTWFGGYYQEPSNRFSQFATDAETYLALGSELELTNAQKEAWLAEQTGALVGRSVADRFDWQLGDRIPLQATIFQTEDGSAWEFIVAAIVEDTGPGGGPEFIFHHDYLSQRGGTFGSEMNWVGQFVSRIDDAGRAAEIAADIDRRFTNSGAETKTATEKAFAQGFANQLGNIRAIVLGITSVVFFTLLLVAGNTVALSVRERTEELGVLKAFGFTNATVMGLVFAEALSLAALGGGAGLALAWLGASVVDLQGLLPPLYVPGERMGMGLVLIVLFALVVAALPAWQALRLRIVDALRSA